MIFYLKENLIMLKKIGDNFGTYAGDDKLFVSPKFPKINTGDMVVFSNLDSSMISAEFEDTSLGVPTTFYFVPIKNIIAVMYIGENP